MYFDGTCLDSRDQRRLCSPIPPARRSLFYLVFCFLILPVWDDFLVLFTFLTCDIFNFWSFSMHFRVLVFLVFHSSVCGGTGRLAAHPPSSVVGGTWLLPIVRWEMPTLILPVGQLFFYFVLWLLILLMWDDFSFIYILNMRNFLLFISLYAF